MRNAYEQQWHAENDPKLAQLPALQNAQTYECNGCDDTHIHLLNFFTAVQNRSPVTEDVVFGHYAAAACHMANQSYFTRQPATRETTA